MPKTEVEQIIFDLEAKPSPSEEAGLALIRPTDLSIFSPGISTGGIAEIRMALNNHDRHVIATTIDTQGYDYALQTIKGVGLDNQVTPKLEDLTQEFPYTKGQFDFIYARLVLHYLNCWDLDLVLARFRRSLKPNGLLYTVVRSEKNIYHRNLPYNSFTKMTSEPWGDRYFHTPQSISNHLNNSGFNIVDIQEYQEQLYKDFKRKEICPSQDHVIQVIAN